MNSATNKTAQRLLALGRFHPAALVKMSVHLCMICVLTAISTPTIYAAPAHLKNKTLNIGVLAQDVQIHPLFRGSPGSDFLQGLVSRPLAILDSSWHWVCALCEDIPSLQAKTIKKIKVSKYKKKMEVTWKIGANKTWGDGTPVTGYDVLYTWHVGRSAFTKTSTPRRFIGIEKVIVDQSEPRRFTIRFRHQSYDNAILGGLRLIPRHLERKIWKKVQEGKKKYSTTNAYATAAATPGLYNGPYIITKVTPTRISLSSNPFYDGPKTGISKINIWVSKSIEGLINLVNKGTITMIAESGQLMSDSNKLQEWFESKYPSQVKELHLSPPPSPKSKLVQGTSLLLEHIVFNMRNPILMDLNIRKALAVSIDLDAIAEKTKLKNITRTSAMMHPNDPSFNEIKVDQDSGKIKLVQASLPKHIRTAISLLEASGWQKSNGEYRQKDGDLLSLELVSLDIRPLRTAIALELVRTWKSIGVRVSLKQVSSKYFFDRVLAQSRFTGMVYLGAELKVGTPPISALDSREIPSLHNRFVGQNIGGWSNKSIDRNFDGLKKALNYENRIKLLKNVVEIVDQQLPVIPLFFINQYALIPGGLNGFFIPGHQFTSSSMASHWSFSKAGLGKEILK